MSAPRYPGYIDSGVAWLGQVPSHWHVRPFKWEIERNDGGVWGDDPDGADDTIVLRSTDQTVDGHWRMDDPAPRKLSKTERAAALLADGDLVVTKSSGSSLHIGKTTIVTAEIAATGCCYSNFMQRIRTRSTFLPKLAWYVMNNDLARLQFDLASNSTTGLANLNGTMIGGIVLPVPPLDEQVSIVAFLDGEITKIDALFEDQQRLIELLKEKRQAVISQAVTKGLNSNVPMKDSGVEWLGSIPAHWEVTRLKHATFCIIDCPHDTPLYSEDGEFMVIRTADLSDGRLDLTNAYTLDEDEYKRRIRRGALLPDDIVYGREGERWGHAALVPETPVCCLGQRMMQFRANSEFCPAFLMWALNSEPVYRQGQVDTVGATSPHVNVETIRNYALAQPPHSEQSVIAKVVTQTCEMFDALVAEAEATTALLRERRTAIITAAVTGKIDVRGLVPQPEAVAA